jgi:hypothetical protein
MRAVGTSFAPLRLSNYRDEVRPVSAFINEEEDFNR